MTIEEVNKRFIKYGGVPRAMFATKDMLKQLENNQQSVLNYVGGNSRFAISILEKKSVVHGYVGGSQFLNSSIVGCHPESKGNSNPFVDVQTLPISHFVRNSILNSVANNRWDATWHFSTSDARERVFEEYCVMLFEPSEKGVPIRVTDRLLNTSVFQFQTGVEEKDIKKHLDYKKKYVRLPPKKCKMDKSDKNNNNPSP